MLLKFRKKYFPGYFLSLWIFGLLDLHSEKEKNANWQLCAYIYIYI